MAKQYDRRTFLRHAAAAGLMVPTLPILGCGSEQGQRSENGVVSRGPSVTRPILLPWSEDGVRIAAPMSEPPLAYVSRGLRRVFVDHDSRGRINVLLAAHISVSSGLWRIPLLGEDLGVPIPADDALREFEEVDVREWDPGMAPVEGDFRIRRGRRAEVTVDFDCAPMSGGDGWFSAGPLEMVQCRESGQDPDQDSDREPCLEAFMSVGMATHHTRRYCTESQGEVRLLTWACPDP